MASGTFTTANLNTLQGGMYNLDRKDVRFLRLWRLADGMQCALAKCDGPVELRLVNHDLLVVRRAQYPNVQTALEAAQAWRLDYEMERDSGADPSSRLRCSACGDDVCIERDRESGVRWLRCTSCGEVWLAGSTDALHKQ